MLTFLNFCYSQEIAPTFKLQMKGSVEDFVIDGKLMYAVGDEGKIHCIDLQSKKIIKSLALPKIKDFMGDLISPKILSIDKGNKEGELLVVSQGEAGYRNVFLVEDWKLKQVVTDLEAKWMIIEARTVAPSLLLIALLSNEIILYDYHQQKIIYQKQTGKSALSDLCLNENKTQVAIADESGAITLAKVSDGSIIQKLSSEHVDKVNKVCFSNSVVVGGGQDRRLSFYDLKSNSSEHLEFDFMVFSLGISKVGKLIVFNEDESNSLTLYNRISKKKLIVMKGHEGIVTRVEFHGNEIITAGEDGLICWWGVGEF